MEFLKRTFPTLAAMEPVKLAAVPLCIIFNVLVFAALLHVLLWPHDMPIIN